MLICVMSFSVGKLRLCGIVECDPRRDRTCVLSMTASKAPVPMTLLWVVQDTSFARFSMSFSFFGNGPFFSKKNYPLVSTYVEEAVSIWRAKATLNVKISLLF